MPSAEPSLAERLTRPFGIFRSSPIEGQGRASDAWLSCLASMASDRATLKVEPRESFGSRTSRRLRREGMVPGVVYGAGSDARAFQVGERDARNVLAKAGALIDVELAGKATPVVVKEEQRHPVRGELIHLDLLEVKLDEAIQSDVAIELLGTEEAPGVKEGGVLEHVTHEITISALPTEIPDSIPADVSGMEIG